MPRSIFIDVPSAGNHTINFSAREDGFEFDKFVLIKSDQVCEPTGAEPVIDCQGGGSGSIVEGGSSVNNTGVTQLASSGDSVLGLYLSLIHI